MGSLAEHEARQVEALASESLMAVGRLTLVRIMDTLREAFPDGVARRELLNYFAATMTSPRSSKGAKGRLALRLYRYLGKLLRKRAITMDADTIRLGEKARSAPLSEPPPLLTAELRKLLFLAMMAEDRNPEPGPNPHVLATRTAYLEAALSAGWTPAQAGAELGLSPTKVSHFLKR